MIINTMCTVINNIITSSIIHGYESDVLTVYPQIAFVMSSLGINSHCVPIIAKNSSW